MGVGQNPGGKWNQTYYVMDLDDFVNKSVHHFARPTQWTPFTPHITKVIRLERDGLKFPLLSEYQRANFTLEGRRDNPEYCEKENDAPVTNRQLASISHSMKSYANTLMEHENPNLTNEQITTMLHKGTPILQTVDTGVSTADLPPIPTIIPPRGDDAQTTPTPETVPTGEGGPNTQGPVSLDSKSEAKEPSKAPKTSKTSEEEPLPPQEVRS